MHGQDDEVLYRYKYRELNDTPEGAANDLKIITEGTLKFSNPSEFNDPFDCSPDYSNRSINDLYKGRPGLLKMHGDILKLSPAKRLLEKPKMLAKLRANVKSGDWDAKTRAAVSVFCTSRNPCIPLMWSHYAGKHTGFIVEFRIDHNELDRDLWHIWPFPVVYSDKRPLIDWTAEEPDTDHHFLTKDISWAYEEEERVLDLERPAGIHSYSRAKFLHSVIAGAKMSDDQYKQLEAAVTKAETDTGKRIPVYRARLSPTTYKVFIPGHPDPRHSSPE